MSVYAEAATDLLIIDLAGRAAHNTAIESGQQLNLELPTELYMIIDRSSGLVLTRAIVLPK